MFLHSGASLHGHEYSNRPAPPQHPQTAARRSPLIRAALSTPIGRASPLSETAKPALRTRRPLSEYVPRLAEHIVRFQEPESEPETAAPRAAAAVVAPAHTAAAGAAAASAGAAMSEDDGAYSASELSDASQTADKKSLSSRRRRRRAPRKSTTYLLAVPPPRHGLKTGLFQQIRPRLLMQLQELSADCRPRPAIDVYPSSMISSSVTALAARKFPRIMGRRGRLALDDVVLLQSEEYASPAHAESAADGERQNLDRQALVAVLSPLKQQDRAEVVLDDGSVWLANPLPNGNYDFVHEDEHGNTTLARWARRAVSRPLSGVIVPDLSGAILPPAPSTSPAPEYRYTFSVINPLCRRHPVMASLTPTALDIQDSYTTVSTSYGRYPPSRDFGRVFSTTPSPGGLSPSAPPSSPMHRNAISDDEGDSAAPPSPMQERRTVVIDATLKNLISVTAVWVALRSGWSPYYKAPAPDTPTSVSAAPTSNSAHGQINRRTGTNRSDLVEAAAPTRRESPEDVASSTTTPTRPTSAAAGRSSPQIPQALPSHVRSISSDYFGKSPTPPLLAHASAPVTGLGASQPFRPPLATPLRATSTGAAFMQRRRQQQQQQHMSDASDSERVTPSLSLRRGKLSRLVSGDKSSSGTPPATTSSRPPLTTRAVSTSPRVERIASHDVNEEPPALVPTTPSHAPWASISSAPGLRVQQSSPVANGAAIAPAANGTRTTRLARSLSTSGAIAASTYSHARTTSAVYHATRPITPTGGVETAAAPETSVAYPALDTSLPDALHNLKPIDLDDGAARKHGLGDRLRGLSNWFRRLGHADAH